MVRALFAPQSSNEETHTSKDNFKISGYSRNSLRVCSLIPAPISAWLPQNSRGAAGGWKRLTPLTPWMQPEVKGFPFEGKGDGGWNAYLALNFGDKGGSLEIEYALPPVTLPAFFLASGCCLRPCWA